MSSGGNINAIMEVKDIVKSFRAKSGKKYFNAVENVSLSIKENTTLVLIGESGCGKSTLGRLVTGVFKPTSGQILYKNKNIWKLKGDDYRDFRRNCQMVHQDPYSTFNPMKTIYDSLKAPLLHYSLANKRNIWDKTAELLEMVKLEPPEDFLNRYPHQLSGGQLQRIAIARVMSVRPKFLVADEIVSMLDASLRVEILDLLLRLKKEYGFSVLFITHDLATARYFASEEEVALMYLGNIIERATFKEVLDEPLHPYMKVLIDSVPVLDPRMHRPLPKLKSWTPIDPVNPPSGCKFHPRCPYATSICEKEKPSLEEVKTGHHVACHLYRKK